MDIRTSLPTNGGAWLSQFGDLWKHQVQELSAKFGSKIEIVQFPLEFPVDVPVVFVAKDAIVEVLQYMKTAPSMEYHFLADVTATDETPEEFRFHVIYQLFSHKNKNRIRIKIRVRENEKVPTITGLWRAANWAEREVWDMFGISFDGHPDLRRILMDERWKGHPLRKDYPLRGYQLFPTPMEVQPGLLEDK